MAPHSLVGKKAPEISLPDAKGGTFTFTPGTSGRPTVLFFYPNSGSYGCTKQVCQLRDALSENDIFKSSQVEVIGISPDPVQKQKAFVEKQNVPYPILSDEKGDARKAYSVSKGLFGLAPSSRVTFVIDAQGIIRDSLVNTLNFAAHAKFVNKWLSSSQQNFSATNASTAATPAAYANVATAVPAPAPPASPIPPEVPTKDEPLPTSTPGGSEAKAMEPTPAAEPSAVGAVDAPKTPIPPDVPTKDEPSLTSTPETAKVTDPAPAPKSEEAISAVSLADDATKPADIRIETTTPTVPDKEATRITQTADAAEPVPLPAPAPKDEDTDLKELEPTQTEVEAPSAAVNVSFEAETRPAAPEVTSALASDAFVEPKEGASTFVATPEPTSSSPEAPAVSVSETTPANGTANGHATGEGEKKAESAATPAQIADQPASTAST